MIEAKTKLIPSNSEATAPEYFVIGNEVTPVREASASYIINTEFTEDHQIVPETQIKRIVVQNKETNPFNKFFDRTSSYLDSLQSFLGQLVESYKTAITQKKSIYASEETEQKVRTQRSKRTFRRLSKSARSRTSGATSLDNPNLLLSIATLYGLDLADTAFTSVTNLFTNQKVFKDIAGRRDYTVGSGQNLRVKPAWIPFPKGTKGLVFTSGYGERTLNGTTRLHSGIDIAGEIGTPIITPITGVVTRSSIVSGYGNMVTVKSGELEMDFAHLDSMTVAVDDTVKAGTKIGELGNTGIGTGPHLHWNILMDGTMVDPAQWTHDNPPNMESEGGINIRKIMVGEAGPEFVVPMSQMPIFADLMMKEKIKSLLPEYYIAKSFDDLGVKGESGFSNMMFSEGAILATEEKIKKYEALGAYTPGTGRGGSLPDYITVDGQESIQSGTPRSVAFNPNTRLYSYIDSEGYPTIGWGSTFYGDIFSGGKGTEVRDGDKTTVGEATKLFKSHVRQLYDGYNETYPLWKHFTDKQVAGLLSYYYNRGVNVGLTLGIHKRALRSGDMKTLADDIERDIVNVGPARRKAEADLIRSGPSKIVGPGIVGSEVGPKEVGTGIPFFPDLTIINAIKGLFQGNRSKTKKTRTISPEEERNQRLRNSMGASEFFGTREYGLDQIPGRVDLQSSNRLNSIPGNEQMQVASETQNEFSFDNAKGQIVALYKPTVYYTEA